MGNFDKLNSIVSCVKNCDKCSRMLDRNGGLGPKCGSINSKILFIGEALGRLGADISRVPFSGDQTGDNFEELISSIGWNRDMFFITNDVLCNPRDGGGTNAKPKDSEIKNCSIYLKEVIEVLKPMMIITLGKSALIGLNYIKNHNIILNKVVSSPVFWNGYTVFPLYNCSPKAFIHRSKEQQLKDYKVLSEYFKEM